jgi:hypothetical protein
MIETMTRRYYVVNANGGNALLTKEKLFFIAGLCFPLLTQSEVDTAC